MSVFANCFKIVFSKLISHIKETPHKFIYTDQDALNLILSNRVKYIDEKYNFLNYIYRDINKNHINFSNIILLHFAIHPKPWNIAWYLSPNCNKFCYNDKKSRKMNTSKYKAA